MKYIVHVTVKDAYILERQEDGTYKKVAAGWDVEAAIRLVNFANAS